MGDETMDPKPLPENLETLIRGYWRSRVLLSAVELDLFTVLEDGATAEEVASRIGAEGDGIARLLRALVGMELLEFEEGRYRCGEEAAEFLSAGGASDSRATALHMANLWRPWSSLTEAVLRGERLEGPQRSEDPAWTRSFIGSMHRRGRHGARALARALDEAGHLDSTHRSLDLGGGSGVFSHALLDARPELRATLFDLPEVVLIAKEHAEAAGLSGRMEFLAGDLRTDGFGEGYDLILISAICHMLSPSDNRDLLSRLGLCLAPAGRLVISDFVLEEDRCRPAWASLFGINMLVATGGGDSYTESDYREWLGAVGLEQVERIEMEGSADLLVGNRRTP
jgi:3-hydroxy-5-methyl-1-naphthoate 3-O-methyltransferase